ncbi:MAG: glycosyltransferase, partial [Alphaproteobacteria bacterium]
MRIWVINQSCRPENNAPANRFYGLGTQWIKLGAEVRLLTGIPHRPQGQLFPAYVNVDVTQPEVLDGLTIWRHPEAISQRGSAVAEALKQLRFAKAVWANNRARGEADRPSVIIASSPDFFHTIAGWRLARRYKVPFILEVRDLWPEIFKDMGVVKNPT